MSRADAATRSKRACSSSSRIVVISLMFVTLLLAARPWLPDFLRWAEVAASYVKPGGFFYLIDAHPFATTLDADSPERPLRVTSPYDSRGVPTVWEDDGTYADPDARLPHKRSLEFNHPIGEIVTSLIDNGLRIEFLHEFPEAGHHGARHGTRELKVRNLPYVIVYRFEQEEDVLVILGIYHTAQRRPGL